MEQPVLQDPAAADAAPPGANQEPFAFDLKPEEVDAATNERLRVQASHPEWEHARWANFLHAWFRKINAAFFEDALRATPIAIERLRSRTLGTYRVGRFRDGLGLARHITLNERLLTSKTAARTPTNEVTVIKPALLVAVLAHEMIHAWEDAKKRKQNGSWYHTTDFRRRAKHIGVPTNANGHYLGIAASGRLAKLLAEAGIALDGEVVDDDPERRPASQELTPMKAPRVTRAGFAKWTCGCTTIYASAGVVVQARCCDDRCGSPFAPEAFQSWQGTRA